MATGRLAGGTLVRRLGRTRLLAGGALLAATGMTAALRTSSTTVALSGFVLVRLGLANLFPLTIARAGALGGAGGVAWPLLALVAAALSVADSPEPARIGMLRVGAAMRRHGAGLTELVPVTAPA